MSDQKPPKSPYDAFIESAKKRPAIGRPPLPRDSEGNIIRAPDWKPKAGVHYNKPKMPKSLQPAPAWNYEPNQAPTEDKPKVVWRPARRKKRDMSLVRRSRLVNVVDNGPLAVAIGSQVRKLRKAAGMTREVFAEHCGTTAKHIAHVETGRVFPTEELAFRVLQVLFGRKTWRDTPNMRGLGDMVEGGIEVKIRIYDRAQLERWKQFAAETGMTLGSVFRYALERLFAHEPTLITIREGIEAAERLRAESILESCPQFVALLKADAALAQAINLSAEGHQSFGADSNALAMKELLKAIPAGADGPAIPIEHMVSPPKSSKP